MANISVRKLEEKVLTQLKIQAAHHGISMEEEARRILTRGITTPEKLGDLAIRLFSSLYDDTELVLPTRDIHEAIKF